MDEVGFSFLARPGTTWAPVGHTPVLRRVSQRRALSSMVGLTWSGKIFRQDFDHAIGGAEVVQGLEHLRQHIPGAFIVVWDRLRAHRAKVVQEYLGRHPEISVVWLPPYAPELNPEELCHGHVKTSLRNAVPTNVEEMRSQIDRAFRRLRRRPSLIQAFFRHLGLV